MLDLAAKSDLRNLLIPFPNGTKTASFFGLEALFQARKERFKNNPEGALEDRLLCRLFRQTLALISIVW